MKSFPAKVANRISRIAAFCALSFIVYYPVPTVAQLSGSYTIGGMNPDYATFQEAINSLQYAGVNGDVLFLVRPGEYSGFSVGSVPGLTLEDTITFQAETPDWETVTITGQLHLNNASNVAFRHFTIHPSLYQATSCILIEESDRILFDHCRLLNPYNTIYQSGEALFKVDFDWGGTAKHVQLIQSKLTCETDVISTDGENGTVDFIGDTITGRLQDYYEYTQKNFIDNTIYFLGYSYDICNMYFEGNQIYCDSAYGTIHLQGNCKGNVFHCNADIAGSQVYDNQFDGNLSISHCEWMCFAGNTVLDEFTASFCHQSLFMGNKFYGDCHFNGDVQRLHSNFFYQDVSITQGPNQQLRNNNFSATSMLEIWYCSAKLFNNNLSGLFVNYPSLAQMSNNNFIESSLPVTLEGENAFHYDPMYLSDVDLHSANPALIRKGVPLPDNYYKYDIDSTIRQEYPSIGANEICNDFSIDQTEVRCNDSICLDVCIEDFTGYYWTPATYFPDSVSPSPVIHLEQSACIYLNKNGTGIVDSLLIGIIPSPPVAKASYSANTYTAQFINLSWCADSVNWIFGDGTGSSENNPIHTFPHSGVFHSQLVAFNEFGNDTLSFETIILIDQEYEYPDPYPLKITPNPAHSWIDIENPYPEPAKVFIINSQGQLTGRFSMSGPSMRVDVSAYPPGIYFFQFLLRTKTLAYKAVII